MKRPKPTLYDELKAAISSGMAPWPEERFDSLAVRIARWHYDEIPPFRALCEARSVDPDSMRKWRDIPAVPTEAFRRFELFAGDDPPREFRTSGTSGSKPGRALFSDQGLELMAEAIRVNARAMLLPDERATRILILAPPPEAAPHMIMAHGMEQLRREHGLAGSRFLIGSEGLDSAGLMRAFADSEREEIPLTLIGASFGFVHLFEAMAERDLSFSLAHGSRAMDAGGFKGRSREADRDELNAAFESRLGIPAERCVNLLGMTEIASQMYDNVMRDGRPAPRFKVNPPWTRTEVVDPITLDPLPPGRPGLLLHVDLANFERPIVVQSDDIGRRLENGGFEIDGRAKGAESRGCSLTIDEMLSQ
ncbi:MAG: hypothetical protein CME06_05135 [Gemmatimonadetes bacterium]|nr:hypothetical protein [Gemmatimonadota bacterium]